jgi:hypothetical protein
VDMLICDDVAVDMTLRLDRKLSFDDECDVGDSSAAKYWACCCGVCGCC